MNACILTDNANHTTNRRAFHELHTSWSFHIHGSATNYQEGMLCVGDFATVEEFWQYFNHLSLGDGLQHRGRRYNGISLFRSNMQPTWEDPQNRDGCKTIIKGGDISYSETWLVWRDICMSLVGETCTANGCRILCRPSSRGTVYKIEVWFEGDANELPPDLCCKDKLQLKTFKHEVRFGTGQHATSK